MEDYSPLQKARLTFQPELPESLIHFQDLIAEEYPEDNKSIGDKDIQTLFPETYMNPIFDFKYDPLIKTLLHSPLRVGVVLSGGQAPGGHNVICGLFDALKKIHPDSVLIGFLSGPQGIIENKHIILEEEKINFYRNQGGFDLLGSGRTKIETRGQFSAVENTLKELLLDGLVIVGGDDSNTNAALLSEYCKSKKIATRIVGVPKTIDGDLKNEHIEISFGFDTACKTYSEFIGNLLVDCLSSKKYYFFVKMMGRAASNISLECALQTHPNLTLISEEIKENQWNLNDIIHQIADLICERATVDKHYGVILIPEGLLEFISDCRIMIDELNHLQSQDFESFDSIKQKEENEFHKFFRINLTPVAANCFFQFPYQIQHQLLVEKDGHGNVQLSKIETERLLGTLVKTELEKRKKFGIYQGKFDPQPLFLGYEGRSALPSNFDCNYCYSLGHIAALCILHHLSGYMACIQNLSAAVPSWETKAIPIAHMLHMEKRQDKEIPVIKKSLVDLNNVVFQQFKKLRNDWRLKDCYVNPGPIQFFGESELVNSISLTLQLESMRRENSRQL